MLANSTQQQNEYRHELGDGASPKLAQPSTFDELYVQSLNNSTNVDGSTLPAPNKISTDPYPDPHDIVPFAADARESNSFNIRMSRTANSFSVKGGGNTDATRGNNSQVPSPISIKEKKAVVDNPYRNSVLDNGAKLNEAYSSKFINTTVTSHHPPTLNPLKLNRVHNIRAIDSATGTSPPHPVANFIPSSCPPLAPSKASVLSSPLRPPELQLPAPALIQEHLLEQSPEFERECLAESARAGEVIIIEDSLAAAAGEAGNIERIERETTSKIKLRSGREQVLSSKAARKNGRAGSIHGSGGKATSIAARATENMVTTMSHNTNKSNPVQVFKNSKSKLNSIYRRQPEKESQTRQPQYRSEAHKKLVYVTDDQQRLKSPTSPKFAN